MLDCRVGLLFGSFHGGLLSGISFCLWRRFCEFVKSVRRGSVMAELSVSEFSCRLSKSLIARLNILT